MQFDILQPITAILPRLPEFLWTLVVGIVAVSLIRALFARTLKLFRIQRELRHLLVATITILLWLLFLVVLLQKLGLTNAAFALSGSLAIITVALGTGANALVADLIAGFHLARDRDFRLGDLIQIGDSRGRVSDIGLRKIRFIDDKQHVHVLPTAEVDKQEWIVLGRREELQRKK